MEEVDEKESEIENKILLILCEKLKNEGIQAIGLEELSKEVGIEKDKLLAELSYLKRKGLIDFWDIDDNNKRLVDARGIKITNAWIETIEDEYSQSKNLKSSFPSQERRSFVISLKDIIIALSTALFGAGIGNYLSVRHIY